MLIIARSLRPRLSLVSELTTAHDSGHDYYYQRAKRNTVQRNVQCRDPTVEAIQNDDDRLVEVGEDDRIT